MKTRVTRPQARASWGRPGLEEAGRSLPGASGRRAPLWHLGLRLLASKLGEVTVCWMNVFASSLSRMVACCSRPRTLTGHVNQLVGGGVAPDAFPGASHEFG